MTRWSSSGLRRGWRLAAPLGLAGWLAATTLAQHPIRSFDRIRVLRGRRPPLPDWRFFAPEPGRWDDHVLVRVVEADGTASAWREVRQFQPRRWTHAVYFPEHRQEKALIDATDQLMRRLVGPPAEIGHTQEYQLLRGYVEGVVRRDHADALPAGFQFLLARDAGHDDGGAMTLRLLSRLEDIQRPEAEPPRRSGSLVRATDRRAPGGAGHQAVGPPRRAWRRRAGRAG
jgi:hypothetical protein